MKLIVCGGRDYLDRENVFAVLDSLHKLEPITLLIHGACGWNGDKGDKDPDRLQGADRWAHEWALANHIAMEVRPALWTSQGRAAGPKRNRRMAEANRDAKLLPFPGGKGTQSMVSIARELGIPVIGVL